MLVRLSDAALVDEFVGFLHRGDFTAGVPVPDREGAAIDVGASYAADEAQARLDLALYLCVWEAVHPGSGAELLD